MRADPSRSRRPWRRLTGAIAPLLVFGCDGDSPVEPPPSGPCDRPQACLVEGPDLVVLQPSVLWPSGIERDVETGRPVVQPGASLQVEIGVRNRGSVATDTTTLGVRVPDAAWEIALPTLEPGDLFIDTVAVVAPRNLRFRRDTVRVYTYLDPLAIDDDLLYGNDHHSSRLFHVALPILVANITLASDTVTLAGPLSFTVTLTNVSRHGATTVGALAFCFFDYDTGCGYGNIGAPFGLMEVPEIEPGGTWTANFEDTLPPNASGLFSVWDWNMYACLGASGETLDDFGAGDDDFSTVCIGEAADIVVRPDLEATCEVAVIVPDVVVTDADAVDCVDSSDWAVDVYALDAVAGATYEKSGGHRAIRADGSEVHFQWIGADENGVWWYRYEAPESERIYLIVYQADYTMELRRVP